MSKKKKKLKNIKRNEDSRITVADGYTYLNESFADTVDLMPGNLTYEDTFNFYILHPTVYAVARVLTNSILKNGYKFTAIEPGEEVLENKKILKKMFRKIHPYFSFYSIMFNAVAKMLVHGHQLIEIDKGNWNIYSDIDMKNMKSHLFDKKGHFNPPKLAYWSQADEFGIVKRKITMKQLIWLRLPSASSGDTVVPVSPLSPLSLDINTDISGRKHNLGSLTNGVLLDLIIEMSDTSTAKKAKELLKYVLETYGNTKQDNSRKPFVIFGGTKARYENKQHDIDFINLREVVKEAVCMVYGVPPRLLAVEKPGLGQGKATEATMLWYNQGTVFPLQKFIEDEIQRQYVEKFYEFQNIEEIDWKFELIREDSYDLKEWVGVHTNLIIHHIESPDEARKDLSEHAALNHLKAPYEGERFVKAAQFIAEDAEGSVDKESNKEKESVDKESDEEKEGDNEDVK